MLNPKVSNVLKIAGLTAFIFSLYALLYALLLFGYACGMHM